ncbi:amidohydrolase family protein [Candidatus Bathyarchaeota archaeon]|nr:amidohydrolase family protein [Candidatus Bathyarchaeota archaeon]
MNIILKQARLPSKDKLQDIQIIDGRITKISEHIHDRTGLSINVKNKLVTPGLIDAHMHLDKALLSESYPNKSGTLEEAIKVMGAAKEDFTVKDIIKRATKVARMALINGTTTIRTHVDVDPIVELCAMEALLKVREAMRELLEIQVVAFPQEGLTNQKGVYELLDKAMNMGADVLGGIPAIDPKPKQHIDQIFELSMKHDSDIDMHIDESDNPKDFTIDFYSERISTDKSERKFTAGHCCTLSLVDDNQARAVIDKSVNSGLNFVTLPSTNLYLQGRNGYPRRRGLTRVNELDKEGANIFYASDNIRDAFNPFGNANMMETGLILAHAAQMGGIEDFRKIIEMATSRPSKALGKKNYNIKQGNEVPLVVHDASSFQDLIIEHKKPLYVINNGRIIVDNGKIIG